MRGRAAELAEELVQGFHYDGDALRVVERSGFDACKQMTAVGWARVVFSPGDHTVYDLLLCDLDAMPAAVYGDEYRRGRGLLISWLSDGGGRHACAIGRPFAVSQLDSDLGIGPASARVVAIVAILAMGWDLD